MRVVVTGAGGFIGTHLVRRLSELGIRGSLPAHEGRALDHIPDIESVVLLDDLAVDEGDEKQGREYEQSEANTKSDGNDVPSGLVTQTESGRSLVDDRECADSASNKEEERGSPDGPADRIPTDVHDVLDQREDDRAKDAGCNRSHAKTSEDGTQAGTLVPSPLYVASTDGGDTDTCDGRDQRVSRRDMSGVAGTPHHPDSSTGGGTGECEQLNASVAVECRDGNNAVLDGRCSSSTDCEGTSDFEDQTKDHSLLVGDRARGNTGSPGVCDIVCD